MGFLHFTLLILKTFNHSTLRSLNVKNDSKSLWFNKTIKYQNKPTFVEEFCKAGIFDFFQLLKLNYGLCSYDEVASTFDMITNNTSFIKLIELISNILIA